jgi:hypothetical protein
MPCGLSCPARFRRGRGEHDCPRADRRHHHVPRRSRRSAEGQEGGIGTIQRLHRKRAAHDRWRCGQGSGPVAIQGLEFPRGLVFEVDAETEARMRAKWERRDAGKVHPSRRVSKAILARAAPLLFAALGKAGGAARAARLSAKQRKKIARTAALSRWRLHRAAAKVRAIAEASACSKFSTQIGISGKPQSVRYSEVNPRCRSILSPSPTTCTRSRRRGHGAPPRR